MKDWQGLQQILDSVFDGVVQVDVNGRIIFWNKAAERITGQESKKVLGKAYQNNSIKHLGENGTELPTNNLPLLLTIKDGRRRETIAHLSHLEGYRVSVLSRTAAIRDEKERIIGGIEIFNDNKTIIASYQNNKRTEQTVLLDPLTGIGNRPHIESRIRSAIANYRISHSKFGILFMDIDNFKEFNDRYGHLVGDKMLRVTANTLRHNLRVTDSCGRWGGEEFIALVFDVDIPGLTTVAEKLRVMISNTGIPESGSDAGLKVSISIGGTLARENDAVQSLIERADHLMYQSKQRGRNCVTIG